jgi:hypothetical protein
MTDKPMLTQGTKTMLGVVGIFGLIIYFGVATAPETKLSPPQTAEEKKAKAEEKKASEAPTCRTDWSLCGSVPNLANNWNGFTSVRVDAEWRQRNERNTKRTGRGDHSKNMWGKSKTA